MMKGFSGVVLRVNLSTGEIKREATNEEQARLFIGGRGYGSKIIYDEVKPTIDPLSPENKVVIATGPTGGTNAPAYDMIIVEGKAKEPVYLWINNDSVELKSAQHAWGKKTAEADRVMKQETDKKARVMAIGPAGVKLSQISSVMFDVNRASGRTGVGAVLGSKNFLGVAVRGTKKVGVSNSDEFKKAASNARKLIKDHPVGGQGLPTCGTAILVNIINEVGGYPTRVNCQKDSHKEGGLCLLSHCLWENHRDTRREVQGRKWRGS